MKFFLTIDSGEEPVSSDFEEYHQSDLNGLTFKDLDQVKEYYSDGKCPAGKADIYEVIIRPVAKLKVITNTKVVIK